MNITRFFSSIMFAALLCSTGCTIVALTTVSPTEVFYSHTNPIEGWKSLRFSKNQNPSPAIDKDYHAFTSKLHLTWEDFMGSQDYFEDGTGQHAITIQVGKNGTYWTYVLIYDRNDKRISVKKYISGHYMS